MRCPFCSYLESKVTDSRNAFEMNAIKRRRECLSCGQRFTTFENVDLTIQVKKRDGTYEDFSLEKLMKGMTAACHHTTISYDCVRSIASEISKGLLEKQVREIETRELGELVMKQLESRDVIAYIRFACVYKRFKDIKELIEAIQTVLPSRKIDWEKIESGPTA